MASSTVGPLFISAASSTTIPSTVVPSSTYGDWHADNFSFETIGSQVQFILRLVKCQTSTVPSGPDTGSVVPVYSPTDLPFTLIVPDLVKTALTDAVSSTLLNSITNALTVYGNAKGIF